MQPEHDEHTPLTDIPAEGQPADDTPAAEVTAEPAGAPPKQIDISEQTSASPSVAASAESKPDEPVITHDWLKIGQKVKARLSENGKSYETAVRDLLPDRLYLDIPKDGAAFVVPPLGSAINASLVLNNNVYFFDVTLEGLTRLAGQPVWVVSMPADFKRVQRRNSLRLDVLLPVGVRVETNKSGVFLPTFKTNCLDISCGGVRYVLDFPIEEGKLVKLAAEDFPGIGKLEALLKAVRSIKSDVSEENYWIGAQFIDLPRTLENKIARHIFQLQRRIVINSSSE
jgi:c-di-GMP-binding flagellar brake protein YcgR